jgi:hypothetical protein
LPTSATTSVGGVNGNTLGFIPENEHDDDRGVAATTTTNSSGGGRNPAPSQVVKSKKSSTYLADSEESRTRRVLLHLEHMCATPEARASLRSWRAAYARKTRRAEFLPPGVSLTTATDSICDDVDSNKESEHHHGGHEFGEKGKRLVRRLRRSLLFSGSQDRGSKGHGEGRLLGRDGMGFVHAQEKEKGWADRCMSKSEWYGKDGYVKENYADSKRMFEEEVEKLKRRGRHFSFF